jgi:eukaryotic-like serine/threonine-protein kinase
MAAGERDEGRIHEATAEAETQEPDEAYCPTCDTSYPVDVAVCPRDGTKLVALSSPADDLTGRILEDRFELRDRLGRGGMGTVYRALQRSVGREVAIKVIDQAVARSRPAARRFLREARLASRLSHPNTVVVFDCGQADAVLYIVMELVVGKTLGAVIRESGPMPLARVAALGTQLCDALAAAHALGIVHRDLKPSNVMVLDEPADRELVKVLDFGLAKSLHGDDGTTTITEQNAIMGTPRYMSPEAIRGEPVDARADLYSLGCILYELVSGYPPFAAANTSALFAQHLLEPPPPPPAAPAAIAPLIADLMAKDPADRPDSAASARARLLEATAAAADGATQPPSPGAATPTPATSDDRPPERLPPRPRSRTLALALGGILATSLVAAWLAFGRDRGGQADSDAGRAMAGPLEAAPAEAAAPRPEPVGETESAAEPDPGAERAAEPDPGATFQFAFESSPPARVLVDGVDLGMTPLAQELPAPGGELEIVFVRDGYEPRTVRTVPRHDQLNIVHTNLRPHSRASPRRPRTSRPRAESPTRDQPADDRSSSVMPDVEFVVPTR